MEKMTPLLSKCSITTTEADLLFSREIPRELQPKIRDQLPEAYTKVQSPPPIGDVLAPLRNEFDADDIMEDNKDSPSDVEESDLELPDAEYDQEVPVKTPQKSKEKVKASLKTCFTGFPASTVTLPANLPLKDASYNQHLHQGQEIYSVPATQEEQVRDVEDLQASAENNDRTDDDPATPKYTLETTDGGL